MRKLFVAVAVIVLSLAMATQCFAVDATEARNPEAEPFLMYGKSGSSIAKVSVPSTVIAEMGSGQRCVGSGRIVAIEVRGVSIADMATIYDSAAGINTTVLFEPQVGVATSSIYIDAKGTPFTNGLYVLTTDSDVFVSMVLDF